MSEIPESPKVLVLTRCLPGDGGGVTIRPKHSMFDCTLHWRGDPEYMGAVEAMMLDRLSRDGYVVEEQHTGKWLAGPSLPPTL